MEYNDMIKLEEFCTSHEVEVSFIRSLEEQGLVETIMVNETICVPVNEIARLEKILRLQRDLNINPEGIEAVIHLLLRIESMQHEITKLRNKLNFYEEDN